jgi:aminobenzoyl-glutamate utilization protein B
MRPVIIFILFSVTVSFAQKSRQEVLKALDSKSVQYSGAAMQIWNFAEVGYKEVRSSELLQQILREAGFSVQQGVAGMPTAFVATAGAGKPVIGILGEYDALPGISQAAEPEKKPIPDQKAGHACGHHLFGVASAAAAIEVKNWLAANKKSGTIRFYGTPAEEGGSGKVYMVREGLFSDVDVALNWHPGDANDASPSGSLANKTGKFRFYGTASHAAVAPERGRSALDAVEAMNIMVNMMREHVNERSRIHYVITRGGEAPNVVPAYAEVYYYVRHPQRGEVRDMWERLVKIANGAALGTDTKVEIEITGGVHELLPNEVLSEVMLKNLNEVGGFTYNDQERVFAEKIQKTLQGELPPLSRTASIGKSRKATEAGSTDVGDVSWVVPTIGLSTATWVPGTPPHSWQAVAAGGTSIGSKGMMLAAKTMALTAIDLFSDPLKIEAGRKEFLEKRGSDFKYEALIGDRKPALNYRD